MEERFEQFLAELTAAIIKEYGPLIYSLVVYGSLATGKARQGSDLDMLLQLKEGIPTTRVGAINDLLLAVEKKYGLEVAWTLRVPLLRHIHPPIIIFAYHDIDWHDIVFHNRNLFWTIALSTGSKNLFFQGIKASGKVLYGADVLKRIRVTVSFSDRLRSWLAAPVYRAGKAGTRLLYQKIIRKASV
jgi:predicted nucleotidyltransferase